MIEPSPAPRRRRRTWRFVAVGAGTIALTLAIGVATFPRWGAGLVRSAIVERVGARLGVDVSVGEVDLGYGDGVVRDLVIGAPDSGLYADIERVAVDFDGGALLLGKFEVEAVEVQGGRVDARRSTLSELAQRLAPTRAKDTGGGRGRAAPGRAIIENLQLRIQDEAAGAALEAWLDLEALRDERSVRVELRQARAELAGLPTLRARTIATTVALARNDAGRLAPQFPVVVQVESGAATLTPKIAVGGVAGTVTLADQDVSEIRVDLRGGFSEVEEGADVGGGDTPQLWSLSGNARRDLSSGSLEIDMSSFELGKVPDVLARLPLESSEDATVGGRMSFDFGDDVVGFAGSVSVAGLNIRHDLLAREPIADVGFDIEVAGELDPSARRLRLQQARFSRRGVDLIVAGEIIHTPVREDRRYRLHAQVPKVSCQKVLEAIPEDLIPSLAGFTLGGDFDLDLRLAVDFSNLDQIELDGNVGIWGCKIKRVPLRMAASRLAGRFVHRVTMRDGRERMINLAAGSGNFTSLEMISPHMVAAVLTTEDGGFYGHRGFLPKQMKEALRRNLVAGRVRLGASTISMQMVKNVLLSHERTLSRKLQEMFLTWSIEQFLPKRRIMEIYLNVVELGPGVYGVTQAARHYFGKHPQELNPLEAAYLALMLPSPVRRHAYYCRDEITPAFDVKLRRILRIMHARKRITDEDYEQWREGEIVFDPAARGTPDQCLAEIRELSAATKGQRALSGLAHGRAALAPDDGEADDTDVDIDLPSLLPSLDGEDPTSPSAPGRPAMDPDPPPVEGGA